MKRLLGVLVSVVLALVVQGARAELTIEITQGIDNPTAIAVVPFAWQGPGSPPEDIASVVAQTHDNQIALWSNHVDDIFQI